MLGLRREGVPVIRVSWPAGHHPVLLHGAALTAPMHVETADRAALRRLLNAPTDVIVDTRLADGYAGILRGTTSDGLELVVRDGSISYLHVVPWDDLVAVRIS